MKKYILFYLLTFTFALNAQPGYDDRSAIIEVIQEAYIDGFYNDGYIRAVELAIANDFTSIGVNTEKQTETKNVTEYLADVKKYQAEGMFPVPEEDRVTVPHIGGNLLDFSLRPRQHLHLLVV